MRVLITGGAGYIGSQLTGAFLAEGHSVTVVDSLLFGGDSLLAYMPHPRFTFRNLDVTVADLTELVHDTEVVYHLAALVGFPACQAAGEATSYLFNFEATRRVFEAAERSGVERFVFASTYSNYGLATSSEPVTEESELHPQSIYAQTKIASEKYLLSKRESVTAPIIPRFTTLFGVSPRTRFDLIVNQFVLEAIVHRKLVVFQGNYRRSFIHVRDVVRALVMFANAPIQRVRGEVFNVGSDTGNYSKAEIIQIVRDHVSGVDLEERELSFGSDMRDVAVSCRKIVDQLGFRAAITVEAGVKEVRDAILSGLIKEPQSAKYRNHDLVIR
jgi:nucleoside-diphosphate-sugar epimerase